MKAFKETTVWDCDYTVPNHVYFLSDAKDKMYGYVPAGSHKVQEMSTPYRFKASGRRFQEVPNSWNFVTKDLETPQGRSWTVAGSKGAEYTVTEYQGEQTCSCPGFRFRGACKHIKETA